MTTPEPLDDLEMSAWRLLLRGHAAVIRRLEAELLAEHGLSLPAYEVLVHLSEQPDRTQRMTELSSAALLSPSGVTRLVDKLQRDGLVRRRGCAGDARVVYCELTEAGMAALVAAYPTHLRGVREHLVDKLDRSDLHGLRTTMDKVVRPAACDEALPESAAS